MSYDWYSEEKLWVGMACNLKFVHLQMATVKFRLIFGLAELLRKPKYLAKINMR